MLSLLLFVRVLISYSWSTKKRVQAPARTLSTVKIITGIGKVTSAIIGAAMTTIRAKIFDIPIEVATNKVGNIFE